MGIGGEQLKVRLNEYASAYFAARGYTDVMARDAKREAWWWLQARMAALRDGVRVRQAWAVVWPEAGRAELVPVDVADAGPGEVTVELELTAVSSGTERAGFVNAPNTQVRFPHRPGYSGVGTVVSVGRGVRHVAPGDRVAVREAPHASRATLPADAVHRVPAGVGAEAAAFVQLGVVAEQGVRRAGISGGERLCVVGGGIVGALALQLGRYAGAEPVAVVARSARRETALRAVGAADFVLAEERERVAGIGAEIVIDATGDPDALDIAFAAAASGGRVVLLGSPRGETARFDAVALRSRGLRLIGAHVSTIGRGGRGAYVEAADRFLRAAADGGVEVSPLVDERVDPVDAAAFYRRLARGGGSGGAVIDWGRLPRARPRRLAAVRPPDLSGKGLHIREPLVARAGELRDPFANATGELRLALVGCGDVAGQNAAAIVQCPNARLVACYDTDAELAADLARRHGAEAVGSFGAVLERRDVDAVFLCVPHHLHAPLALEAIAGGKHVIVEKPPANDLAGAAAIAGAARRAGVAATFCFPHRYEPQALLARQLIEAGTVGDLTGTFVSYVADKTDAYWHGGFSGRSRSTWRMTRAQSGGGVLIMNASHDIDLVRSLTGAEAGTVTALVAAEQGIEVEDSAIVAVSYEQGGLGTLVACSARRGAFGGSGEIHVWGSDGQLVLDGRLRAYTERGGRGIRPARWTTFDGLPRWNARAAYVSALASAIARGEEPDVTPADGLAVQAFLEAAYVSAELRRPVEPNSLLREAVA